MNIETIEKMYDEIIAEDDDRDQFHLLSESRNVAISQIRNNGVVQKRGILGNKRRLI